MSAVSVAWEILEIVQVVGAIAAFVVAGIVLPERLRAWRLRRHIKRAVEDDPSRWWRYEWW